MISASDIACKGIRSLGYLAVVFHLSDTSDPGAREAKLNQRSEIRRAEKKFWNTFLQNAKGSEV